VRFVTKLNASFVAPPTVIAIPADLTRFSLSSLVNALIQSNDADYELDPFDFFFYRWQVRANVSFFSPRESLRK